MVLDRDTRTLPRVRTSPLLVAANGPRSVRYRRDHGDGWITTPRGAPCADEWFDGTRPPSVGLFDEALAAADATPPPSLATCCPTRCRYCAPTATRWRARWPAELDRSDAELGFTDLITHWPRTSAPYAGSLDVLERIAADVLPGLRG